MNGSHLGFARDQLLLLPEAIDDYVDAENPVRFIDAFVDGLDLAAVGLARVEAKATGRPGYAPGDLLKLYIYGYLNRIRSSRRLEREAQRNIEVIWLVRGLKPDFKMIADFRRDNCGAFKSVFRQFVLLCRRLDLYGRELLAVDGTRIKAVNNKDRNFTRASLREFIRTADERLNEYPERLDHGDVEDGATNGGARTKNLAEKIAALGEKRGRYQAMLAQLERTNEAQISLTDPDSRAMATHTKVGVGYNVQVAVDARNKLIVEQAVTNQVVDMGLLTQTAEPAREILGRRNDRRRRRPRLLQGRGHRGLREGRLHPARSQTATRLLGARGLLPQGRVLATTPGRVDERVVTAQSARDARTTCALFPASKTRPRSTAWPSASKRGPRSRTVVAKSSSIRSAVSSSGCIGAPSQCAASPTCAPSSA